MLHIERKLYFSLRECCFFHPSLSEFTVIKCGLSCRSTAHFHCCYCAATILNRSHFVKHLEIHQKEEHSTAAVVEHPEASMEHPEVTMKHPEASIEHPVVTMKHAEATLEHSEAPVKHPEAPMNHPDHSRKYPEPPLEYPEPSMELPETLKVLAKAPAEHPEASVEHPEVLVEHSEIPKTSPTDNTTHIKSNTVIITCPHCSLRLNKKNFKTHCQRKHTYHFETVSKDRFLACECVDVRNGVFAVEKSLCGSTTPIHIMKCAWGSTQKVMCEADQCRLNSDLAQRSGMLLYECHHLESLLYCPHADSQIVTLTEEALEIMVENKWFDEESKASLLRCQQNADAEGVPLSVQLTVGGPPSKIHVSVHEPIITHYSRLGRVIVSYDTQQGSWNCPCSTTRQSCTHKAVAKWHLFVTNREIFQKVRSTETLNGTMESLSDCKDCYPPDAKTVARMLNYLFTKKKLPAELPECLIEQSREGRAQDGFIKHLIPKETDCTECGCTLGDQQLITSKGKILTSTGVVEGWYNHRPFCCLLI